MSEFIIPDLDLDCNKEALDVLKKELKLIPAARIENGYISQHLVGGYPMNIPTDPVTGFASIDYRVAETKFGYFKLDLLHNTQYDAFKDRDDMIVRLKEPCKWEMLKDPEFAKTLPHLAKHIRLLQSVNITSIEELAMFLAVIRPAKKYLIPELLRCGWGGIEKVIWTPEEVISDEEDYQFKKSHAFGYAVMISLRLH